MKKVYLFLMIVILVSKIKQNLSGPEADTATVTQYSYRKITLDFLVKLYGKIVIFWKKNDQI